MSVVLQLLQCFESSCLCSKELLRLSPILISIGALVYLSRRAGVSIGGSGKGVRWPPVCVVWGSLVGILQGIFGVGKSTAKMINKETNIKTKFRCGVPLLYGLMHDALLLLLPPPPLLLTPPPPPSPPPCLSCPVM